MKQLLDYIIIFFVIIVFLFPSKNLVTFIKSRLGKLIMLFTIIITYYQSKVSGIILAILMYYLNNTYYENYSTSKSEWAKEQEKKGTQLIGYNGKETVGTSYNYEKATFDTTSGKCPCPNDLYPIYSNCYSTLNKDNKKKCDNQIAMPESNITPSKIHSTQPDITPIDDINNDNENNYHTIQPTSTQTKHVYNNNETKLKHGKWKHFKILFDKHNKFVTPDRFKFVNNVCDINNFNCDYIIQEESMRPTSSNNNINTPLISNTESESELEPVETSTSTTTTTNKNI